MKSELKLVLTLIFCTAVVAAQNASNPVMCYECSSHENENGEACYDPFQSDKFEPVSCPTGLCVKYYQNVGVKDTTIKQINRGCAAKIEPTLLEKEKDEGCVLSTGTKEVKVEICNCKTDNCNAAAGVKSASSTIFAAGLVCLLAKLVQ